MAEWVKVTPYIYTENGWVKVEQIQVQNTNNTNLTLTTYIYINKENPSS